VRRRRQIASTEKVVEDAPTRQEYTTPGDGGGTGRRNQPAFNGWVVEDKVSVYHWVEHSTNVE